MFVSRLTNIIVCPRTKVQNTLNFIYHLYIRICGSDQILIILQYNAKKKSKKSKKEEKAGEEDNRDINQLLEFIQLDDRKVQDKKKKRKKKQKSKEGASSETEAEVQEAKVKDKSKKEEE